VSARSDRLTAVALLVFAGYTVVSAWRLGYWQGRIPGPGFAPLWIGAGLVLAAFILLLRRAPPRHPATGDTAQEPGTARREAMVALQITAMTVVALVLVPWAGMMTAVGLLLLGLVKLLRGTWSAAVGTAIILPVAFYLLFVRWLHIAVPTGPWGF